jgi:transposase
LTLDGRISVWQKGVHHGRESPAALSAGGPEEAVRLIREGGLSFGEAAKVVGCSDQSVRSWVAQADRDAGRRHDGLTTEERAELSALRRRVKTLEQEKEILKKAAAWFAKETHSTP